MTLRIALTALLIILGCSYSIANAQQQPRILVASAADFITGADRDSRAADGFSTSVAEPLRQGLSRSGRYQVIEREAFRRVMDEQNVGQGSSPRLAQAVDGMIGDLDRLENMSLGGAIGLATVLGSAEAADISETLSNSGTAVGADFILIGRYDASSSVRRTLIPGGGTLARETIEAELSLRLIRVSDSTLSGAATVTASASGVQAQRDLQNSLTSQAVSFVNDSLFPITLLSKDPLVVNRGTNSGWSVGDTVSIQQQGQQIRDQGIPIGRVLTPVAEARVASVQSEMATLSPVDGLDPRAEYTIQRVPGSREEGSALQAGAQIGSGAADGYRVAISRLGFARGCCSGVDGISPAIILDLIEQRLNQSGRFDLVDRRQLDQSITEIDLQSALQGEPIDTSAMIGADYIVIGRLDQVEYRTEQETIRAVGRTVTSRSGTVDGTFYLIDVARGAVETVHRLALELSGSALDDPRDLANAIATDAVRGLFVEIVPFEVVSIVGDQIYLSQGENWGVQVGEIYEIVSLGQEMFGSDGRSFGRAERKVGEVRIHRVQADRSLATLLDGGVNEGDRVRAAAVVQRQSVGPAMTDEEEW